MSTPKTIDVTAGTPVVLSLPAERTPLLIVSASADNAPVAEVVSQTAARGAGGRGGAGRGGGAAQPMFLAERVVPVRAWWRVTTEGAVQRSLDAGTTWNPVFIDGPQEFLAGSAPYQNVCWLVGRQGVVYRTISGTAFTRAAGPVEDDLVAVQATDGLRARITTRDGRVFVTVDGGATWTLEG